MFHSPDQCPCGCLLIYVSNCCVVLDGGWYCCPQCELDDDGGPVDHILEYTKALVWRGLGYNVRRRVERSNDGPAMLAHWRLDMLDYWQHNHCKYLILGHLLLAGTHVS